MDVTTPLLAILHDESERDLAVNAAAALGYASANVVVGSPAIAASLLQQQAYSPRYILISIGPRQHDVLPEIDQLAMHCDANTRVIVLGQTNDISFYRALIERGVTEYYAHAVTVDELRKRFSQGGEAGTGQVIAFIASSASDGCSTLAVNTAYSLAADRGKRAVIVDFDYQFGMVAKHLDLAPQYGIKELFDHPDRGIDEALMARMVVPYRSGLDIIAAPGPLQLLPPVRPETIRDLIAVLQRKYDYVVIDLPHVWTPWVSSALANSQHIVLVSQLWLKSVNHAARLLAAWNRLGFFDKQILNVINRSGSKFKEALSARDFERVCGRKIDHHVANDIKTVVKAENEGKTVIETGNSQVASDVRKLAELIGGPAAAAKAKKIR